MRKSRFTDEQMVAIQRGSDRTPVAEAANQVCACDFAFESCADGQQLKCLTVLDEFTHSRRPVNEP